MSSEKEINGFVISNWVLLAVSVVSGIMSITSSIGYAALAPAICCISIIWLVVRIIKYGFKYCFKNEYAKSQETHQQDTHMIEVETRPYPMESGAINAAIGAVDKCCEFAAYCEKYVIPSGMCSPEPLGGYIIASPSKIGVGFTWKTFYYTLDSLIEKQGYNIHEGGFSFSENSGMVSFQKEISNDASEFANAYSYMINTPTEEIISEFQKVANNNYMSLGIINHSAECRCTISNSETKGFEFTV